MNGIAKMNKKKMNKLVMYEKHRMFNGLNEIFRLTVEERGLTAKNTLTSIHQSEQRLSRYGDRLL